ncbi:TPA: hypothetical protein ACIAQY_004780, partial [Salmonella enterica subsp. diarizonae serovar 61:l,v:z35]
CNSQYDEFIVVSSRIFENLYEIVSYRHLIKCPGRVSYLTLYKHFLIDLPHDSLIFSIYIPRHDDLSGD